MRKLFKVLTVSVLILAATAFLVTMTGSTTGASFVDESGMVTIKVSGNQTGIEVLEQDKNGITIKMDIGNIKFVPVTTKAGNFILPRIDGFTRSFKVGEPMLPVAAKLLGVPFDCTLKAKVLEFTTANIDLAAHSLTDPIMPVQPSLSKSDNPLTAKFEYNQAIYETPGKYALKPTETKVLGTMRSIRMARVAFAPVEYYPTEKRLTIYKSAVVRIKFNNPNWAKTKKMMNKYDSVFFNPINSQLLNFENINDFKDDLVKYPVKYLIIADRMFESQLVPFIEWKTRKGFNVVTAYTDVIGTTTSSIKSYIQGLYNAGTSADPAPSFVLFVGDVQQIPSWSGSSGSHITDLRYCEFTGDDYPEIYHGRFSAQNTTQLQPQIDKTLEYEQYTMPDPSYLGDVTLVSGVDSSYAPTHGNGQINYGTNYYFNAAHGISPNVWLYPASDASGAAADVIQTISDGVGFFNYTAHCSHTGPADPAFDQGDVANLTNSHKYLLGIGNCCLSNTFGDDYSTPCFGEAWLQEANKGGIGWIGGSNSTYWDEDYWWGVGSGSIVAAGPTYEQTGIGAYDGIFHDHGEAVTRHYVTNGGIIFAGNMAVTEAGSSRIQYYWEIYHLMGDPSVMTYMGLPSANSVSLPSSIATDATTVSVQAASGSYVGITFNGTFHGAGYIDDTGSANIAITPFGSTGNATIVVTCQNRIPYETTIPVNSGSTPPAADFTASPTSGIASLTVNFTDQSTGATSWSWNFGDTGTSTLQNPSHTYTTVGTYTVTLTATNANGSDVMTKTDYINVTSLQGPIADFSASSTSIYTGESVTFTDQSTNGPTSWSWTCNGGTPSSSTSQNPVITYNTVGTYSVTLEVSNAAGNDTETKTNYITVSEQPLSYCATQGNSQRDEWIGDVQVGTFSNTSGASPYTDYTNLTAVVTAGNSVNVSLTTDYSGTTYTECWTIWIDYNMDGDFEDAGESVFTSTGTGTQTGSFTVSSSAGGVKTRMRISMKYNSYSTPCEAFSYGEVEDYTIDIQSAVVVPPVANFSASATTIDEGQSVNFTDLSTNNPTSWAWTFTGGTPSSSTAQNPSVTYNTAGTYTVSLTATNSAGNDVETKTAYITVEVPVITYCASSGGNQSYEWVAGVTVGSMNKTSGSAPYSDFTATTATLTAGGNVSVSLTPGFASSSYNEYWVIFIDYNGDGDFDDSGEQVFSGSGSSVVTGNFTVSSGASGTTRMRVVMSYNSGPTSCGSYTYGETEDYTVTFN